MTKIKIIGFHPEHVNLMDLRPEEHSILKTVEDVKGRMIEVEKMSVQAGTFMYDGVIIFAAGFYIYWPGVAEGWNLSTTHIEKAPMFFARTMKRYVESIAETFKLHRIQTTAFDDPFHERWMGWLGFEKEGTMRKFTPDKKNQCMYARLF